MTVERSENLGIALALVAVAAASTGIGAAVVFFPSLVKLASRKVLAGSLGFSAGVMCYVSFIEIFQKSILAFEDALGDGEENDGQAYAFATLTFFGGVVIMALLNAVVVLLVGGHHHHHNHHHDSDVVDGEQEEIPPSGGLHQHDDPRPYKPTIRDDVDHPPGGPTMAEGEMGAYTSSSTTPCCCTKDPVGRLDTLQKMASVLLHEKQEQESQDHRHDGQEHDDDDDFQKVERRENKSIDGQVSSLSPHNVCENDEMVDPAATVKDAVDHGSDPTQVEGSKKDVEENKRLVKMGMTTALAIGLHNFPEGLATFVAALNDPQVGVVLAVAIAIHNIPEGLCVALPIFYATGNRKKAFLWAILSGASEIVAALLGWIILSSVFTDATYGTLFGLVAGMMIIISIKELLPTAHFYDPEDTVVTNSFIAGMVVMALSLVLFKV